MSSVFIPSLEHCIFVNDTGTNNGNVVGSSFYWYDDPIYYSVFANKSNSYSFKIDPLLHPTSAGIKGMGINITYKSDTSLTYMNGESVAININPTTDDTLDEEIFINETITTDTSTQNFVAVVKTFTFYANMLVKPGQLCPNLDSASIADFNNEIAGIPTGSITFQSRATGVIYTPSLSAVGDCFNISDTANLKNEKSGFFDMPQNPFLLGFTLTKGIDSAKTHGRNISFLSESAINANSADADLVAEHESMHTIMVKPGHVETFVKDLPNIGVKIDTSLLTPSILRNTIQDVLDRTTLIEWNEYNENH